MARSSFVFASDFHGHMYSKECMALFLDHLRREKPSILILGGDIIDCVTVSRFPPHKEAPDRLLYELEVTQSEVIAPILKASPKARHIWLEGNHEWRLEGFIAAHAKALQGFPGLSIQEAMKCKEQGIEYITSVRGNGHIKLGPILFQHGFKSGVNAARAHLNHVGGHTIFGHTHKEHTDRLTYANSKNWKGPDWLGLGAGAMCVYPEYDDLPKLSHGFVAGWLDEEEFEAHHERIVLGGVGKGYSAELFSPSGSYLCNPVRGGKGFAVKKRTSGAS